jgi:hypothetical protein
MKKKRNHPLRFIINKNNPHLLHIPFTSFFFIFTPTCYLLPPSPTGFPLGNVLSVSPPGIFVVYYESIKRELKIRCIYECRCDERLQTKTKDFTRLTHTGLVVELEHLEIETRLIDEKFANVMGEYVT